MLTAEIRFAERKDMDDIIELCKAHALFEKSTYSHRNKALLLAGALFDDHPSLKCLVVLQNQKITGYATFMKQFSTWDAAFYLYLDCLYLEPAARGAGLGKQIMDRVKKYARENDCTHVQWQTPEFNTRAIHFYKSLGAKEKNKVRFFLDISGSLKNT